MGFFDFLRKDEIVDYSPKYNVQKKENPEKTPQVLSTSQMVDNELSNPSENAEERKKKLVRRIVDMSERMENLSIQLYHLQQRIELIEKKMNVSS